MLVEAFEPLETEIVKKMIKKGDIVLDIGANIGYYTLIFAKIVGKEGKIYAFEPDLDNLAILKKNVKINGYKNIKIINKVVSNKTGRAKLYLNKYNTGDHRIFNSSDNRNSVEIETIRLDDYFKHHLPHDEKINFIKMDIQGAEIAAIQGMPLLLKNTSKLQMVLEFFITGLKFYGFDIEKFINLLLKYDFEIYHINEKKNKIEPINISELNKLEEYAFKRFNFTNFYCVKKPNFF